MPSLKQLEEIKKQLRGIANEPEIVAGWGEKYVDIPLPKDLPMPEVDVDDLLGSIDTSASGNAVSKDETPTSQDFDNILSGLDLDANDEAFDIPEVDNESPDVPEALLDGIDNIVEESRASEDTVFPEFDIQQPEANFVDENSDNIEELTDLEAVDSIKDDEQVDLSIDSDFNSMPKDDLTLDLSPEADLEDALDLSPEDSVDEIDDLGTLPDLDESLDLNSESNLEEALDLSSDNDLSEVETLDDINELDDLGSINNEEIDLNSDKMEEFDLGSESLDDEQTLESFESIEETDSLPLLDGTPSYELDNIENLENSSPSLDEFDPTEKVEVPELDEHTAFAIDDDVLDTNLDGASDDFSLPESFSEFSPDKSFNFLNAKKEIDETQYEDKIPLSISESDYSHLIEKISSFPLNVRLEIQDYLANGDDSELNKMEIVNLIVKNVSLKKIVAKLEAILDKPISIPRGFDKKSYEEYEREKKSFKYRLVHKILPVAVISGIIAIIAFCFVFLSWQFIYKPIVAEGIYHDGYALIGNGKYASALTKFDEAGTYRKKRKWYFNYANAFRQKKQFFSAEKIYIRLLFDFNHDKEGGIEYADMLSKDLRNYEKAEKILKRQVLDYHINDADALLALGDTYLEWADEDPDKYDEAKKIFVSLINSYGRKDIFLSRMLRYFIRTDNLAEVLPLKEHFMYASINSDDLIELSGYLLQKRYEPKPYDNENLRARIDDVRELLERSLKSNLKSPEAHYNMGKFYIHNYKPKKAKAYLAESIHLFEDSIGVPPRRLIRQIDSLRLYGELLVNEKRYNEAQEIYARGLAKYEEYTASKLIYPDPIVGKLYENYGNISYFISGDYDSALLAFQKALIELNNTPSIQYKIGYIHYSKENYFEAMKAMTLAYSGNPTDKNILYGFANVFFKRGDYFSAQAYYQRLMDLLEAEKIRKGIIFPQTRIDHGKFVQDYMKTTNNLGVVLNRIATQLGDSNKNARAIALFGESSNAWDALTRNPETMIRAKTVNLAFANIQNIIKPRSTFKSEIYSDIPKTLENEKVLQQLEDK